MKNNQYRLILALVLLWNQIAFAFPDQEYNKVNYEWIQEALHTTPGYDPRGDNDPLSPLITMGKNSINKKNFSYRENGVIYKNKQFAKAGWGISGNVVDFYETPSSQYVLYGRVSMNYDSGIWNEEATMYFDYVLVKFGAGHPTVVSNVTIHDAKPNTLIGLKPSDDGKSLQVMKHFYEKEMPIFTTPL